MLNAYAKGGFGFYSVNGALNNYQDVSVGADGRLDIQRNWNVYGGASWNRRHDEFGTPNTPNGPGLPVTVYNQSTANVGYFQTFNRLNVRLDGRFDNYNYLNNGLGPAQGVIPNSDRNRNEWREALRFGYQFSPGYEVWVRGSLNQRKYFQLDTSGLDRSSNGFDIVGGMIIDLGGITAVEIFAGYLQQTYVSGQFSTISTPTFGLTGYWNPIAKLVGEAIHSSHGGRFGLAGDGGLYQHRGRIGRELPLSAQRAPRWACRLYGCRLHGAQRRLQQPVRSVLHLSCSACSTCRRRTSSWDRRISSFTAPRISSTRTTIRTSSCCGWAHGCSRTGDRWSW